MFRVRLAESETLKAERGNAEALSVVDASAWFGSVFSLEITLLIGCL